MPPEPDYLDAFLAGREPVDQEDDRPDASLVDVSDGFIESVVKNAFAETTIGIGARLSGWEYQPRDLGLIGNVASGIGGFLLDPATYLGGTAHTQNGRHAVFHVLDRGHTAFQGGSSGR
jgi:hypothetical protein